MAITIDWESKVISVQKADMTLVQSTPFEVYELNLNTFRLKLKDLEDDEAGIVFVNTHNHNTEVVVGGVTLARVVEIINGYTVTFEDGQYAVNLVGANSNVADVVNLNQVSVRTANSAGLIQLGTLTRNMYAIESQRATHQAFGNAWFLDPVDGDDGNAGDDPNSAVKTFAEAQSRAVSGRGDVIFLLSNAAGVTTLAENLVITKEDLHLRGPGRGFQIQPTSGTPILVQADNCSLSGLVVRAPAGSTTTDCIVIEANFSRLWKLYVYGVGQGVGTGRGVVYRGGGYHELLDLVVEKCGGSGVLFEDAGLASGSPRDVDIHEGHFYANGRSGIEVTATGTSSTREIMIHDVECFKNTRYGVEIGADVGVMVVEALLFANDLGPILDGGSSTEYVNTGDEVWGKSVGTPAAGTFGDAVKKGKEAAQSAEEFGVLNFIK